MRTSIMRSVSRVVRCVLFCVVLGCIVGARATTIAAEGGPLEAAPRSLVDDKAGDPHQLQYKDVCANNYAPLYWGTNNPSKGWVTLGSVLATKDRTYQGVVWVQPCYAKKYCLRIVIKGDDYYLVAYQNSRWIFHKKGDGKRLGLTLSGDYLKYGAKYLTWTKRPCRTTNFNVQATLLKKHAMHWKWT